MIINNKKKLIIQTIIAFLVFWVIDAAFTTYLCQGISFQESLIFKVPFHEIIRRSGMFAIIFFFIAVNSRISVKHKQIKKVLGEREQFLENIFASIQEGLIITDPEFNIIRVNSVMEQWYEHAGPLVGRKCYEALYGRNEPCDACPGCVTLETGAAAQGVVPKMGPEGEVVGWLALFSSPLADAATGEVTGVIGFARDITAQVQAEEALRKERDFVASILDTISSLVVVLDPGGASRVSTGPVSKPPVTPWRK